MCLVKMIPIFEWGYYIVNSPSSLNACLCVCVSLIHRCWCLFHITFMRHAEARVTGQRLKGGYKWSLSQGTEHGWVLKRGLNWQPANLQGNTNICLHSIGFYQLWRETIKTGVAECGVGAGRGSQANSIIISNNDCRRVEKEKGEISDWFCSVLGMEVCSGVWRWCSGV